MEYVWGNYATGWNPIDVKHFMSVCDKMSHRKKEAISKILIFMDINGIQPCNMQNHFTEVVLPSLLNSTGLKDAKTLQSSRECTENMCELLCCAEQSSWGDLEPHREGSDMSPRPGHAPCTRPQSWKNHERTYCIHIHNLSSILPLPSLYVTPLFSWSLEETQFWNTGKD